MAETVSSVASKRNAFDGVGVMVSDRTEAGFGKALDRVDVRIGALAGVLRQAAAFLRRTSLLSDPGVPTGVPIGRSHLKVRILALRCRTVEAG